MSSRLSPVAAFRRVTMRQAIEQRCFDFEPKTVEAGTDRDITVTAELENTTDESFDHVWRIEIDGSGIGFNTTTVPPGETVRPQQTQVIPEALLPVDGGFVDVVIQQIGGFQQTTRCGNLEVLPTEAEPVPEGDIVLTDLRVPSTVTEGDTVTIEIVTECVDGFCEQETLTLTVGGSPVFTGGSTPAGPFEQGRTRTFTADVTFDTTGPVDVVAELDGDRLTATVDVQEAVAPGVDPTLVSLEGCEITPREVDPGDQFVYSVFVSNGNPEPVDIDLTWSFPGGVLDRDLSRTVPAGASGHELTFETTTEIARLLPGQTVDVTVEVTNSDVGIALSGRCGQVSVTGGFDEAAVFVPENDCTVSPLEVTPPQNVDLQATVFNGNPFSAIAEVEWVWEGLRIASTEVSVDAESQATARATASIEREGRGQITAEVIRASGGVANSPRSPAVSPARAGASNEVSPN